MQVNIPLKIIGLGRYLPKRIVPSSELEALCGVPAGWVERRNGVRERRWVTDETSSFMSAEALAGGPIGKVRDGDVIEIVIDRNRLEGTLNVIGVDLDARELRDDLRADKDLPDDTRLWAALQAVSGGAWSGCVYDVDRILAVLAA